MTREEKQKAIDALKISAPVMVITQEEFNDYIQTLNKIMDWLEQEPTTKNDLVAIHTGGLDEGIRCAMCTNSMKSDRGCDGACVVDTGMYKKVMDVIEKMIEPTPTDCISRANVLKLMRDNWHTHDGDWAMQESMDDIRALPSVTPQEPKTGHWIPTYGNVKCSVCGSVKDRRDVGKATHYCDFCGARMDKE